MTKAMLREHATDIQHIAGSIMHLKSLISPYERHGKAFPRIALDQALALPEMESDMWAYVVEGSGSYGRSITRKGEHMLIQKFGGAVWLVEMYHVSVPFCQAYIDDTRRKARCGDLLLGLGEVIGCGNRHVSEEEARGALAQHEINPENYKWYLDMRKVKALNTTGRGIGTERFVAWVLQHDDIRDIQLLPRLKGIECYP